ncbi:SpoIIE family protein phosphatase [bacterium]|nr:SpoIIE family protein phosphatase [bacterium]
MMLPVPEKATLLVVDDTPENLTLMSGLLKDDYKVKVANGGERALKIAASESPPDLILLDIMMPEMDGYEVCRRLKADPRTSDIPVVFLTAKSEVADETMGLSLGAVDYITKPISPPIVLARIKTQLLIKRVSDFLRDQNAYLESEVKRRTHELLQSTLARQQLESDLKVALRLQRSMLPRPKFQLQNWQIEAFLKPAKTIGGDLYEYLPLPDQRLLFAVGDVSDKGVAAALFMVRVLTLLRWLAPSCSDPAHLLQDLNRALCQDNDACMFVTLGMGFLDLQSRQLLYASGGHEPPVLLGGTPRLLELSGGPALGLTEAADFPLHQLRLEPGQSLILLSDGVAEANNPMQAEFGFERLLTTCEALGQSPPARVVAACLHAVETFTAGAEPNDDLTLLVISGG